MLYWDSLAADVGRYTCADDEPALAAYRQLEIRYVPCLILKPQKTPSSEAAIWVKQDGKGVKFVGSVASKNRAGFPHFPVREEFPGLIEDLTTKCVETRNAIKLFHKEEHSDHHYHQMLYALLIRHERILDSIKRLLELKRAEHAAALIRVAYEAFLNFYIDWLSPAFFGSRLQYLGAVRELKTDSKDKKSLDVLGNFQNLFESTSEKARLSPLGTEFHSIVYPHLSRISHQSYGNIEAEATDFSDQHPEYPALYVDKLGKWINVITAALLFRVRNEIGLKI